MISVEFRSVKPGQCQWCRREKDQVYSVAFSDHSFVGPLCKGDLLRAIGMKLENGDASGMTSGRSVSVGRSESIGISDSQSVQRAESESISEQSGETWTSSRTETRSKGSGRTGKPDDEPPSAIPVKE